MWPVSIVAAQHFETDTYTGGAAPEREKQGRGGEGLTLQTTQLFAAYPVTLQAGIWLKVKVSGAQVVWDNDVVAHRERSHGITDFRDVTNSFVTHDPGRVAAALHAMVHVQVRAADGGVREANDDIRVRRKGWDREVRYVDLVGNAAIDHPAHCRSVERHFSRWTS